MQELTNIEICGTFLELGPDFKPVKEAFPLGSIYPPQGTFTKQDSLIKYTIIPSCLKTRMKKKMV